MIKIIRIATLAIGVALPAPLVAQDFDVGMDAAIVGDYATALDNWRPLAEQGNAMAQLNLGLFYDTGQGVLQDYAEAAHWYRLSAEQGTARAQYNLGRMYDSGRGVLKSLVLAHMWHNIASANGNDGGVTNRNRIENQMTQDQIAEAQALARVCMSSGYQDCE